MKKIIALAAALFVLMTLFVSVPANAAGPPHCKQGARYASKHINDGSVGADEWTMKTKLVYNYCRQGDKDWIVPLEGTHSYDFEGDSMSCNRLNPSALKWMKYTTTFTGGNGRTKGAPQVAIKCNKNSKASFTQHFGGGYGRFVFKHVPGNVIRPKFSVKFESETRTGLNQVHGSYESQLQKVS